MKKWILGMCAVAAILMLSGCHRMDVESITSGQVVVIDGANTESQALTEKDLVQINTILNNKPKEEVTGCAFYKNWYIQLGDAELRLADDGCPSIWLVNEGCAIILSQDDFAAIIQIMEQYPVVPLI